MNKNLLSVNYWFNLRPGELAPGAQKLLIGMIILLAVLAIAFYILGRVKKGGLYAKIWKRAYTLAYANVIFSGLFLFFTYEMIPFLSARFWFILIGLEILIWLYFIIRNTLEIPKRKEEIEKEKEFKKYIP